MAIKRLHSRLEIIFRLPQFEEPEKQRIAQLLHIVILVLLLPLPLTYLIQIISVDSSEFLARTVLTLVHALLMIALLRMLHRGLVQSAATIMAGWLWLGLAIQVIIQGTVDSPSFHAFTLAIIVGGLLTGARGLYALTVLTVTFGIAFLYIETQRLREIEPKLLTGWATDVGVFLVTGMFLYIVTLTLQRSAAKAQASAEKAERMADTLRQEMAERSRLQEQLQMVYDQALDMMVIVDKENRYTLVNPAVERILGYEVSEMIGRRPEDFIHPDDLEAGKAARAELRQGVALLNFENRFRRKDGTYRRLSWTASTFNDQILGIARDVTELRDLEAQKIQIEADRRMVAMRQDFVTRVSHEFRTPLSVIQVSHQILERYRERLTEEQHSRHLGNIRTQVALITQMIDEIILISRFNAGAVDLNVTPVVLENYCRQIFAEIEAQDTSAHNMSFTYCGPDVPVQLDTALLRHILHHLLSNAVKFAPEGGHIRFEVNQDTATKELVFTVADTGIGINSSYLQVMYDPFSRAQNAASITGTGLGLTIVRESVEKHTGTIKVESVEGEGTCFTVRLPLALATAAVASTNETSTNHTSPSG